MNKYLQQVVGFAAKKEIEIKPVELPQSAHSAIQAAEAVNCKLEQIAKSLIFKTSTNKSILIITAGNNYVNENKISSFIKVKINRADAIFVKNQTGFSIGGVPPFGHKKELQTIIDEDLLKQEQIWAAAGTPSAVFAINPKNMLKIIEDYQVINLKR